MSFEMEPQIENIIKKKSMNEKIKLIWNKSMYLYINRYDLKEKFNQLSNQTTKNIQPT